MGSSHESNARVTTPTSSTDVSASERAALVRQASTGSVGTPTDRLSHEAAWALGTPPSTTSAHRPHDHVQFVMMQSQSSLLSPTPTNGNRPHFVPVTSTSGEIGEDQEYHTVHSPSSAPGEARRRDSHDAAFLYHRLSQPDGRQYAASSPGGRLSRLEGRPSSGLTFVSERNVTRDAAHELARQALSHRKISIGDVTFDNPHDHNLRESVRRVHAHSRREAPLDYELTTSVKCKGRVCQLQMDRERLEWKRSATRVVGCIDTDDIVAAHALSTGKKTKDPNKPVEYSLLAFRVHYFVKGSKGNNEKALKRKHKYVDFLCESGEVAYRWVHTIQELVRWQARAPPIAEKRKIKIVVNPHSGRRRACRIWHEQVKQFFEWGNFECVVEETAYSGHAIDMGRQFNADDGFEAMVFIGGDGTLCEFMNGLLSRPEHEWREIVATTPLSLISAGTQNAFGQGVGIPTIAAAVYCIIKRKIRPLDVITASAENEPGKVHYSYCGVGWGIAGDIAAESEKYRWMGVLRYAFLKVKRAVVMPKRHTGRIRYVPTSPQPVLRKYFDIRDEGALDQFDMEEGNVYDSFVDAGQGHGTSSFSHAVPRKSWGGFGGAIRSPASGKRYPEPMWVEEKGHFMVVGCVNAAPDGAYSHPSDGNLDLIISRKGSAFGLLKFALLYLVGRELESPLISYLKVKALVIEQDTDQAANGMNIDGEVLPGPGPWRMEIVPSLFKALSEK